jgi:hypothetical protein
VLRQAAGAQPVSFQPWWINLGRRIARLIASGAHVNVVLTIKDGKIQNVREDRSYLPADVPAE